MSAHEDIQVQRSLCGCAQYGVAGEFVVSKPCAEHRGLMVVEMRPREPGPDAPATLKLLGLGTERIWPPESMTGQGPRLAVMKDRAVGRSTDAPQYEVTPPMPMIPQMPSWGRPTSAQEVVATLHTDALAAWKARRRSLPQRCPRCERIHVRAEGCGSIPKDFQVVTAVDAELAGPPVLPEGAIVCAAESSLGAVCSSEPGHEGQHRGRIGAALVEWS